jgi:hypothetical protein
MIQSFLDASEDAAGRCVTVAGFFGSMSGWCKVQERMQGIRDRVGVPYLHMTDLMAKQSRPPYNRLKPPERTALITEIGELLGTCLMFGVSSSLNLRDFYALPEKDRALFDNNPRGHCLAQSIGLVSKLFEEEWEIDESVLYVVETGGRGEAPLVNAMWDLFRADPRVRDVLHVANVMPGSKKESPAFDTADIYARLANQHALTIHGRDSGAVKLPRPDPVRPTIQLPLRRRTSRCG